MKKFDPDYALLRDMYHDDYFPSFLIDKVKERIKIFIAYLEEGNHCLEQIQTELDKMTVSINDLQEEFYENESELETVARESIAETVEYILEWFGIDIDIEDALIERDW